MTETVIGTTSNQALMREKEEIPTHLVCDGRVGDEPSHIHSTKCNTCESFATRCGFINEAAPTTPCPPKLLLSPFARTSFLFLRSQRSLPQLPLVFNMLSNKVLVVVGLIAPTVLAGTPQGYGYGGVTDSLLAESTDSPESMPSGIMPITITGSITVTKPVTVTHTVTVSQLDCGGETTTIYSTTRTTRTTQSTIFISVLPTPKTSIETSTSVPKTGSFAVTSSIPIASTTGYAVGNTTTSCESNTSKPFLPTSQKRWIRYSNPRLQPPVMLMVLPAAYQSLL